MFIRFLLCGLALATLACAQTTNGLGTSGALGTPRELQDVQLTGTAQWQMGAEQATGPVILKARRDGKSRIDLDLGKYRRSEIRVNDSNHPHLFFSTGEAWQESAIHNELSDANWFFPAFSAIGLVGEGLFNVGSAGTNKVRAQVPSMNKSAKNRQLLQILSITDFDLDPTTDLPTRMRWNMHPDDNYNIAIPCEVTFSDYRSVSGVKVPFHIQRYFNGTLQLDIILQTVTFNVGIPVSDFSPKSN